MKNKIQWNKVTWYSKGLALVIVTALPMVTFVLGYKQGKKEAEIEYKVKKIESVIETSTSTENKL